MEFKWNLQPEFAEYKKNQKSYGKDDEGSGEYVGCARCGNLCFDIMDWGNHLWFDLYVGGVDTGYGYGDDEYPYDYCDVASFKWDADLTDTTDEVFESTVERYIEEHICAFGSYITDVKAITVSLIDKASERLREW